MSLGHLQTIYNELQKDPDEFAQGNSIAQADYKEQQSKGNDYIILTISSFLKALFHYFFHFSICNITCHNK